MLVNPLKAQQPIREGVRPDEMADLVVIALTTSPTYPLPGEAVSVEIKVRNQANHLERNVVVTLFVGDQQLASKSIDIEAGGTATIQMPWTASLSGTYTLTAVVDSEQKLTERERLDNVISVEVVVAAQPPVEADFTVLDLDVVSVPERPAVLRATVRNNGAVTAQAPIVLRAGSRVVAVRSVGPIEPGDSVIVEVLWGEQFPITRVSAEVNPRARTVEKVTEDNILERELRPSVDLRVEGLSIYAAQFESTRPRQITVNFRIANAGREAVTTPFRTSIFPGVVTQTGLDTFYVTTHVLPVGKIAYVSHTIVVPVSEFDVRVEVDADHIITEADEANNVATSHFKNPTPDVGRWVSIGPRRITGSKDHGYAWNDAVGRLSAIAIHPKSPATIYVGARGAGVWKTIDGGTSWQPIADIATLNIAALAIDPSAPSRVYFVTEHEGVFRSEDAGISWIQISDDDLSAIVHGGIFLVNPTNSNVLYLASSNGVYRSRDGGVTWRNPVLSEGQATGLVMDPSNPSRLYAAIRNETTAGRTGIYETTDGGTNWRKLTGCPGGSLPTVPAETVIWLALSKGRLYASFKTPSGWTLYRTTDISCSIGGRQERQWEKEWSPTGKVGGEDIHSILWSGMWVDPTDPEYVYLGGTYFWRSTDSGANFELTSGSGSPANSAHVDHHAFAADPLSPKIIYTLNDGGIYRSSDRGKSGTWKFIGEGIANVEFYDHAAAVTQPNLVIGGTQDDGTIKYDGSSTVWKMIRGGDGATVDIDPTNAQILYSMVQYASSIAKSKDGGSFTGLAKNLPTGPACFNLHYQVHPGMPSTLLASCNVLWRTTTSEPPGDWKMIFTPPSGNMLRSAVDATINLYYAGSSYGRLYAGPGGTSWPTVFIHPTAKGITDIEVDLDDPITVYASFSGTSSGRVYRLRRSSPTPTTMAAVDMTSDLPTGLSVRTLAIDRMRELTVYAGTQKGVYRGRSTDGGTTWHWRSYNNGLPFADIRDLEVHPITGVMRAATFGRSAFEVNTDFPIGSLIAAEGKITLLRVHDVGTGYGPKTDFINVEVVIKFDGEPNKAFGFQLRNDANEGAHRGMLDRLRDAFNRDRRVRIDYVRTGLQNGRIQRVMNLP